MSSTTNTAINSRSMNGVITISDGQATLENGDLNCDDIISSSLNTSNINTSLLTCSGKFESNLNGPYTIPVSISNLTGLLISYGNVTNSGATDFTNFQSTYTSTQGGFRFFNKSATQTLTNLAIIDNSQTYFSSPLTGCLAETPLNNTSIVNKTYVDSNFLDRTNNLTQNVNGLKTFSNNTNFTGSLLSRTNIKLSEYENTPATNTITLNFPMSETIALRTTPLTSNPMTINLPLLTNNERGYVFTFNKLFDTSNATNRNFPVTFNTSGGQGIYTLFDQFGTPTTNTTLLSVEKIQCKLAVGWVGSLLYWIEQTDFSTYDRYKLTEWGNATTTNTLTLTLPLPPTIALRTSTESTMTINLPTISALQRGQIFTFYKLNSYNYDVIFNTSSGQAIYPMNNLTGAPTTNTTIFPSNKKITKLAVGWFGNSTYWIEVSDYSTFDRDQNNLIYARLASPNAFTNTNTFNSFLPTSTLTPSADTQLITKKFADDTYINFTTDQTISGTKRFNNCFCTQLNITPTNGGSGNRQQIYISGTGLEIVPLFNSNVYRFYVKDAIGTQITSIYSDYANTIINNNFNCVAQATFNNICPISNTTATLTNHLTRKDYVDNNFVDRTNNLTQNINGLKTFTDDLTVLNIYCDTALYFRDTNLGLNKALIFHQADIVYFDTLTIYDNYWKFKCFNIEQVVISQLSSTFNNKLISLAQARFENFTPTCTVSSPTQINHLTRKDYVDNNFLDRTNNLTQNINGLKTFTNNLTCSSSLISNNLTSPTATSTNNIYTTLSSGGIVNFGSAESTCNFNSDTTFVGNIFSETAIYFKDIGIGSQLNQARIFKQDDFLYFDTNINYTNGYSFRHSSNDTLIITSSSTTIENNLISNGQATFNNFTPICSVSSPTANNHLTRKDYVDNNFVDRTNNLSQNINGVKTFTETIYVKDFRFKEVGGSANTIQAYLSGTDLGFISINVNNNRYFFNTKDGAGNPTTPLLINSASTTISNNLVSNNLTSPTTTSTNNIYTSLVAGGKINIGGSLSANYIFGSTEFSSSSTFNVGVSFLGISSFNNGGTFSEIEQTSGSQLVIRNTTNTKKIILSTTSASTGQVDSLVINTTSCDILSPTLNLNSSSTINILTPNNLTGIINFLSTLTTATINFCSTAYTSIFNLNARLAHKGVQYMNDVKTISGTSPPALAFPLEQMWMFTSTGGTQIVVTLPEITASHQAGFNFIIFKTASNTNSVLFNRSGTNTIRGLNSITDVTSITRLSGTNSVGVGFYTAEVSTGNFAWISY